MVQTYTFPCQKDEEGNLIMEIETRSGFEKIKKNREYCKEKNCEKELEKGGLYYSAFSRLYKQTLKDTLVFAIEYTAGGLGTFSEESAENLWKKAYELIANAYNSIKSVVRAGDFDGLMSILDEIRSTWIKCYFDYIKNNRSSFYGYLV